MALITYKQAKAHLRLADDEAKADVLLKMEQATALVMDRIGREADDASPAWTESTDPTTDREFALVQAAILITLADLWRFRGDDEDRHDLVPGLLPAKAERILYRLKDPSLA